MMPDLVLQQNGDGAVDVVQADPKVIIPTEMLDRPFGELLGEDYARWFSFDGKVLKVFARNRTVVYHVTGRTPDQLSYIMEWPD